MEKQAVIQRFEELLGVAESVYELLGRTAAQLHEMAVDEASRESLLDLGQEAAAARLDKLWRRSASASGILDVVQFVSCPSRRTLRDVIDDGSLGEEELESKLYAYAEAMAARYEGLPEIPHADLVGYLEPPKSRTRAIAAVMHEETDLAPSDIGRRLGMNRSQVYSAVDRYRSMTSSWRFAIAREVWPEVCRRLTALHDHGPSPACRASRQPSVKKPRSLIIKPIDKSGMRKTGRLKSR